MNKKIGTFYISFIGSKRKNSLLGYVSIYARITINKDYVWLSTKHTIPEECWIVEKRRTTGETKELRKINKSLNELEALITVEYKSLFLKGEAITPQMIKDRITGNDNRGITFVELFHQFKESNTENWMENTEKLYQSAFDKIVRFINEAYKTDNVYLSKIDGVFIQKFQVFLLKLKRVGKMQCTRILEKFRYIFEFARRNGYTTSNPFATVFFKRSRYNVAYLTMEELKQLITTPMLNDQFLVIKDIWLFCAFTGFSYNDIIAVKKEHFSLDPSGKRWLRFEKPLNKIDINIKLFDILNEIVERYLYDKTTTYLFKPPKNTILNEKLKVIAKLAKVDKYLSLRIARHTFALTVALNNGMSTEVVSSLLGYQSLQSMQIYTKHRTLSLSEDLDKLEKKNQI